VSEIWPYIAALIPPAGVGFLFYLVIKNMIEGDRRERLAHSRWEAEQEKARGNTAEKKSTGDAPPAESSTGIS
jgi:hypothetical protein